MQLMLLLAGLFLCEKAISQDSPMVAQPQIFTFVEQMPKFPGGEDSLVSFIQKHLNYPPMERDNDIEGKVLLRFVVLEDGSVSDVEVIRKVSPGLDKEAARVIKSLLKFNPGMQQGKPVKVYYNLPVQFSLNTAKQSKFKKK
jgi:protein TonB